MKREKLIAAAIFLLAVVIVCSALAFPSTLWQKRIERFRNIGVHEAYAMITYKLNQTYMIILDARTQAEFDAGHIVNAINIPHSELEFNLSNPATCPLAGHENDLILVYCKFGGRSSIACEILAIADFQNVYNMIGGITQWSDPVWNYTVVVGPPAIYTPIGASEAYLMVTSGSPTYGMCNLVVDVRTSAECNAEHIVNSTTPPILHALSIPWVSGVELLGPLAGYEYEPIIVYCQDNICTKSDLACQYLVDHGFRKVYKLDDGLQAWKSAGYPTASTPPPPYLFSDGFESGGFSAWTGTIVTSGNTLEVSSTQSHHGTYSCHVSSAAGGTSAYAYKTLSSTHDTLYVRIYVRFTVDLVNGASGVIIMKMASSSGYGILNMRVRKTGDNYVLEVGNYAEGQYYSSLPFAIAQFTNNWYCVELQGHIDGSTGWLKALWDGSTKVDQSNMNTGTTQIQRVSVGTDWVFGGSVPIDFFVDCVIVSTNPIGCEE